MSLDVLRLEIMSGQVWQKWPMNEGFTHKSKSFRFKIKSLNKISSQSKIPLNRTLEIDEPARACRKNMPDCKNFVGAALLYQMM